MENGDIVTVVTLSGEYVGKLTEMDTSAGVVTIKEPRMIVQSPDGQMGFARGIAVTGVENPDDCTFMSVVFATPTNDQVRSAYQEATSSIIAPPSAPKLVK
jgi:hypothetical protein